MPSERFSRKVIDGLLGRPQPIAEAGHPIASTWQAIRAALAEWDVVTGPEVVPTDRLRPYSEPIYGLYELEGGQALRNQMSMVTFGALPGRTPPVRLLAAGRVFRPDREDSRHLQAFYQVDGVAVAPGPGPAGHAQARHP